MTKQAATRPFTAVTIKNCDFCNDAPVAVAFINGYDGGRVLELCRACAPQGTARVATR